MEDYFHHTLQGLYPWFKNIFFLFFTQVKKIWQLSRLVHYQGKVASAVCGPCVRKPCSAYKDSARSDYVFGTPVTTMEQNTNDHNVHVRKNI